MNVKRVIKQTIIFFICSSFVLPQFVSAEISNGMPAENVIGQYENSLTDPLDGIGVFSKAGDDNSPNNVGFSSPNGMVFDEAGHRFFVADGSNNRVLVYTLNSDNTFPDHVPDYVIGQANFAANVATTTQIGLVSPQGVAFDPNTRRLFVAQSSSGRRVTVYDTNNLLVTSTPASHVLGQTSFTANASATTQIGLSNAQGLAFDPATGRLFVTSDHRVVVYSTNSLLVTSTPASHVLGQTTFTGGSGATGQNTFSFSRAVAFDPETNRLFIANDNRVTVYNTNTLLVTNTPASFVIGAPSFTSSAGATTQIGTRTVQGVVFDPATNRLFVSQGTSANRVTVYNTTSLSVTGTPASYVIGQDSFTTGTAMTTQIGLNNPQGLAFSSSTGRLFIQNGNRVTVYNTGSLLTTSTPAENVIGQYENSLTDPVSGVGTFEKGGADNSPNNVGVNNPSGMVFDEDGHRFFLVDSDNNRVLVYTLNSDNTFPDHVPDYVIGQASFATDVAAITQTGLRDPTGITFDPDTRRLYVASSIGNRVTVYDTNNLLVTSTPATHVIGQSTFTGSSGSFSQSGLSNVQGLAYDSDTGRLFVASSDSFLNRVTVYDTTNLLVTSTPASHVIGQDSFTAGVAATTQIGMRGPQGLAFDPNTGRLFVASFTSNRVTVYDTTNLLVTSTPASYVIGQSSFTASSAATTQIGMRSPYGIAFDPNTGRLFISQHSSANRVTVYDTTNLLVTSTPASYVIGQPTFTSSTAATTQAGLSNPRALVFDPGNQKLFVSDATNNRVVIYDLFEEYTPPATPSITSATATALSVQLSWSSVLGATSYTVSSTATSSLVTTGLTTFNFIGLTPSTTYSFQVRANDSTTSSAFSSVTSTTTDPLLVISNVTSTNVGTSSATISWTTNRLTSSRILYGFVTSLGVSTTEINTLTRVLEHEVTLTNLVPCTIYNYTPRVVAGSGDFTTSTKRTFATRGCQFSAPIISYEASVVSSSSGGSIAFLESGKGVALTVPTGFTSTSAAAFQLKRLEKETIIEDGGLPIRKNIIGSLLFDFKAIANTSTVISTFDEPVEVTMTYDPDDLDGADPATLSIFRYTEDEWTELSPCTVNTGAHTVTCDTPGFSLFALMGEEGDSDDDDDSTPPSSSQGGIPYLPPTLPSATSQFSINQGAQTTNSRLVSLHISSPNASMVAVSTDPTFSNGSFESLISPLWFTLPVGNGEKIVYIKLRTSDGGELILSDTITLTSNACPLTQEHSYKSSLSSSVFYVTPECTRRPIPNERTYFTYFSSWKEVSVVTNATLTAVPLDPLPLPLGPLYRPTYGALIKTLTDPKVYVLINDTKYWITNETVFTKLNYHPSWIEDVDPRLLDAYKVGQEITRTDVHPAFTLIKYSDSPKVYRLEVDPTDPTKLIKRWIVSESAFKSLNFRGDRIIIVDAGEVYGDGQSLE